MRPERRFKPGMDGGLTAAVLVSPPLHLRTAVFLSKQLGPPQHSGAFGISQIAVGEHFVEPVSAGEAYTFEAQAFAQAGPQANDAGAMVEVEAVPEPRLTLLVGFICLGFFLLRPKSVSFTNIDASARLPSTFLCVSERSREKTCG